MVGWQPKGYHARRDMSDAIKMLSETEWKTTPEIEAFMTERHGSESAPTAFGIEDWDTSCVTSFNSLFRGCGTFNSDISKWNTSSVTTLYWMFEGTDAFHGDLSKWDVSKVREMKCTFADSAFNGDISKWNTSAVVDMSQMFYGRRCKFNGDISQWNLSSLDNMDEMFGYNQVFNTDISNWDVSNVKTANAPFVGSVFKGDTSKWFDGKPPEEWPVIIPDVDY